jgi:hypothetical protein
MVRQGPVDTRLLADRFLVASRPVRDLLLFAKDLFIAATVTIGPAGLKDEQ